MIYGLLVPVVAIALLVLGILKLKGGDGRGAIQGHSVRRFFQYLLLYGLLIVGASGLSGLLGRLLVRSVLVNADQSDLARNLSFAIVGIPLYTVVSLWTRRKFIADPAEAKSFAWGLYRTLASVTSLIVSMIALHEILGWAAGINNYSGQALARLIVWGAVWGAHWWLNVRVTPNVRSRSHHLIGSLIGLGTVVMGLTQLLGGTLERVLKLGGEILVVTGSDPMLQGAVVLVVGIPVWFLYWIRNYSKSHRDPLWLAYVLLVGVGGGLVMALFSASTALYSILVWFLGQSSSSDATVHFRSIPSATSFTAVGIIVWWYHHAVLEKGGRTSRTEVQRVYEYLMAGIGLLAAAGGLAMVLVALVESMTRATVIVGNSGENSLLGAMTLLVVGSPVWWIFWRRIQLALLRVPLEEQTSPTRRVYLFLLFGIGGITAVITLLVGVFFLFDDILKGNFGQDTIRRIRYAFSVLVITAAIAGYHWMIYRTEREHVVAGLHGPRFVLLVGPKDPELVREIARSTGGRVQSWTRSDDEGGPWPIDEVMTVLDTTKEESIIIIADSTGLRTIPVDRD